MGVTHYPNETTSTRSCLILKGKAMRRIALALIVAVIALTLAACSSSSSESAASYGNPIGSTAADGTTSVELSGLTFTIPKGFDVVDVRAGARGTNSANEQVTVYVNETVESERRLLEGNAARDWLKLQVDNYGSSVSQSLKKTKYGDVGFQEVNGVEFAVKSGTAQKDDAAVNVVIACCYHEKMAVTIITVTSDESDLAFDVAKSMK